MLSRVFLALSFAVASLATSLLTDLPPFNSSLFKDLNVTRGLTYHYYASPADAGKPTLVFLHGFPSSFYDWRHQVSFFQDKGYGLVVPDMLGYGGTAKPLDPEAYAPSLISKDIIDILDAEGLQQSVLIGHDWGAKIASRLANYFPQYFSSYAFLAGYTGPDSFALPYPEQNNLSRAVLGYETFGYWDFFSSEGADQIILANLNSLFDIFFLKDTVLTIKDFAPLGALGDFIRNGRRVTPGDFVTPEERAIEVELLRQTGLAAPLNWYKILTTSIESDDDQGIPSENAVLNQPVFFGTALRDYVGIAATFIAALLQDSKDTLTIQQYDSGHWVMLEVKDKVNSDLLQWIEGLKLDVEF
ncbi:alpha/beta-hydrolase [Dendrothele bispora CBS 962.96]|uniref:Alpha/beta-hydrolase n=1 Tax=Dendrothele bispora (strain CBS 962.96) TaxID=1314807 RepID=A0A4V4HGT1_DENBC|nr:alpha/beta-hydrolase [Dendrothele bispora CBS 962.96]